MWGGGGGCVCVGGGGVVVRGQLHGVGVRGGKRPADL